MPTFSAKSLAHLETCHPLLQQVFQVVIAHIDCTVLEGRRTIEQQAENVRKGVSQTMDSKHLHDPSLAVDVAPYPIDWQNRERFVYFGGMVLGVAAVLGVTLRWGGDWNRNHDLKDQRFMDLPHFELVAPQ